MLRDDQEGLARRMGELHARRTSQGEERNQRLRLRRDVMTVRWMPIRWIGRRRETIVRDGRGFELDRLLLGEQLIGKGDLVVFG